MPSSKDLTNACPNLFGGATAKSGPKRASCKSRRKAEKSHDQSVKLQCGKRKRKDPVVGIPEDKASLSYAGAMQRSAEAVGSLAFAKKRVHRHRSCVKLNTGFTRTLNVLGLETCHETDMLCFAHFFSRIIRHGI